MYFNNFSIEAKHVSQNLDFGIYSTTKNAVATLSRATSNELKREKSKIRVTVRIKYPITVRKKQKY